MILKNQYCCGALVMWYEIEMFPEYIASCKQMLEGIENPENVTFHFCFNFQEYLENIEGGPDAFANIGDKIAIGMMDLAKSGCGIDEEYKHGPNEDPGWVDPFYNIAAYRRDLNHNWCEKVDYVLWGETDSLWPKQTLQIIEAVSEMPSLVPKFVLNFAGRKNWDASWQKITHPLFENVPFEDNEEWMLNNEASEKSYMALERMNEINDVDDLDIRALSVPKADGSCLVISSELIKSGVNIPHALIHCGEDESFLRMAKKIMGDNFVQYHIHNILRVHNRRHPKKRSYILNENNPRGFCGIQKGEWWDILERTSKENLENLTTQVKFHKTNDVIASIQKLKEKN